MATIAAKAPHRPLVQVEHLRHYYGAVARRGTPVIDDVNLTLNEGEIVGLLGRSGSGKSTLLRSIAGLIHPSEGEVRFTQDPERNTPDIAMVFQTFALFPWLTVLENVEIGLEAQRVPPAERHKLALAAIDLIGLDGYESAYPKELSGGMRQRVGLARAIVVDPALLLLDEPFRLRHGGTRPDLATAHDVADIETDDIASTQLAIDRDIEKRAVTEPAMVIEIEADAPDLLRLQRPLRSNFAARVPGLPVAGSGIKFRSAHRSSPMAKSAKAKTRTRTPCSPLGNQTGRTVAAPLSPFARRGGSPDCGHCESRASSIDGRLYSRTDRIAAAMARTARDDCRRRTVRRHSRAVAISGLRPRFRHSPSFGLPPQAVIEMCAYWPAPDPESTCVTLPFSTFHIERGLVMPTKSGTPT